MSAAAPAILIAAPPPPLLETTPPDEDTPTKDNMSTTTSTTATTTTTPTTSTPSMGKQDRKRLKKLRKRATNVIADGEKSGIATHLEWLEFQKLVKMGNENNSSSCSTVETTSSANDADAKKSFGPAIARRKRKEDNKVEGSHHRDLVAWFMDRMRYPNNDEKDNVSKQKKRARNNTGGDDGDDNDGGGDNDNRGLLHPSIPSWASIHNPACMDNLVVLEVQVSSSKKREEEWQLEKCCQSLVDAAVSQSLSQGQQQRTPLHLPTKWFQGHAPKTMSDSLLYFVANSSNSSRANKRSKVEQEESNSSTIMGQLLKDMEEMILPLEHWSKEGYPIEIINVGNNDDPLQTSSPPSLMKAPSTAVPLKEYDSIPIEEATEFVAKNGFRIEAQKEDDAQLYMRTCTRQESSEEQLLVPAEEEDSSSDIRIFGMDCEMVLTSMGSELARITLVQFKSFQNNQLETTTVLDALVKPENPVRDYLTRHSGITAELLEPVSTRLVQIQVALRQFLRPTDILIGHSLENDLMAAHYLHPRVIDTSLIFRHRNKRTKFSLRHMSAYLLKKTIQQGSHCSQEDAEATLELAIRRAWLGEAFALPNHMDERRSILEKWNGDKEMKMVCIGPSGWIQTHVTKHGNGAHALACDSIAECKKALLAWTKQGPRQAHLAWCQLNIQEDGATSGKSNDFEALQQLLVDLLENTLPTTTILVNFQQGLESAREVFAKRRAGQDPRSSLGWSTENEAAWQSALEKSRTGMASWIGSSNRFVE